MTQPRIPPIPGAGMVTDTFDFVRHLWSAMPGLAAPALSVDELDKRIADLKAVEAWLNMNAAMLRGTIHTLEVQRGTVATLNSMGASLAGAMSHAEPKPDSHEGMAETASAWWNMLQEQFTHAVSGAMATPATGAPPVPQSKAAPKRARKAAPASSVSSGSKKPAAARKAAPGSPER